MMRFQLISGSICFFSFIALKPCIAFAPPLKLSSSSFTAKLSSTSSHLKLHSNQKQKSLELGEFHPFPDQNSINDHHLYSINDSSTTSNPYSTATTAGAVATILGTATTFHPSVALADPVSKISVGDFNPDNFRPVCPSSDGLYRLLQGTTEAIVGEEQFVEYGPLIAGGLLRVRLELCVVESFFNEAVGPFIKQNGLTWILPLHETVETFLAGTIFALATTFILVGSTKIVSVLITYGDVFLGGPMRLFGGFIFDRARGKPVTLDIGVGTFKKRLVGPPVGEGGWKEENQRNKDGESLTQILESLGGLELSAYPLVALSGAVKGTGEVSKVLREILEALDVFVGRYLTLIATGYIGLKFIHFKVFPDFPPF